MQLITPILILLLFIYSYTVKRVNVYESFIKGACDALPLVFKVLPYMAAMLAAMSILRVSGLLEWLFSALSPLFTKLGVPAELAPMLVLRPFSGSAAMALLEDAFKNHGADSFLGVAASLLLGSTETIFYTVALYFGSIGVKKTRAAIPISLASGLVGAAAAIFFAKLIVN